LTGPVPLLPAAAAEPVAAAAADDDDDDDDAVLDAGVEWFTSCLPSLLADLSFEAALSCRTHHDCMQSMLTQARVEYQR